MVRETLEGEPAGVSGRDRHGNPTPTTPTPASMRLQRPCGRRRGQVSWLAGRRLRPAFPGECPVALSDASSPLTVAGAATDEGPCLGRPLPCSLLIPSGLARTGTITQGKGYTQCRGGVKVEIGGGMTAPVFGACLWPPFFANEVYGLVHYDHVNGALTEHVLALQMRRVYETHHLRSFILTAPPGIASLDELLSGRY
ncbi:hypothetical protein MTBUT4_110002 [Magnetospirillum sp. UT-4]|nr:hypothetical protein MTBUT4_110002 [Magnetospirillum sp. UT-4]